MIRENKKNIKFLNSFDNQLGKAPEEIIEAFFDTLELFLEDPDNYLLRNHPLEANFTGYRSIDVTADWRAVFKETNTRKQKIITFHMFGTHKQLYGR